MWCDLLDLWVLFVPLAVCTAALLVITVVAAVLPLASGVLSYNSFGDQVITLAAFSLALGVPSCTLLGGSRVLLGAMLIMVVRFQIAAVVPWSKPESTLSAPCFPPGFAAFASQCRRACLPCVRALAPLVTDLPLGWRGVCWLPPFLGWVVAPSLPFRPSG